MFGIHGHVDACQFPTHMVCDYLKTNFIHNQPLTIVCGIFIFVNLFDCVPMGRICFATSCLCVHGDIDARN